MVHLDAHPDLASSSTVSAQAIFESPHEVYCELQKDPGGIAQWILPAVYGGHFSCVWWVRPPWAEQISDGDYRVAVGRSTYPRGTTATQAPCEAQPVKRVRDACVPTPQKPPGGEPVAHAAPCVQQSEQDPQPDTIRISCAAPYFVEDGTFCPEGELKDAKPLRLVVSELPPMDSPGSRGLPAAQTVPWTLDVCLDYFACGNPFLTCVRPHIAAAFAAVLNRATFRQSEVTDVPTFLSDSRAFDEAYGALLRACIEAPGEELPESLLHALGKLLPEDIRSELLADLEEALQEASGGELHQILEAGDMATLPLSLPSSEPALVDSLSAFERFLKQLCSEVPPLGMGSRPAAVTIARSVVDGFCPMRWLCMLEAGVLDAVRRCLGDLQVIYSDELDALDRA